MASGLSTFDKVKYVICALGGMAGGVFIAWGPQSLRDEIPYHFEIGMGFVAFGVLLLLALFVVRIKSLLLFVITGLFAAACAAVAYDSGLASWQLYIYGTLAVFISIFSLSCLYAVFSGDDPVD